ncbi:hypothetical protein HORIV_48350 [Vreelandella olivaria]|uniref:Uncharacterized protein n=1 Tax=Vreelandella olivaria TaxID=390919 RepID=A0ABN5WZI1_9GAMM|nr:hypothetical protein HORIV_48350 [Halomonas olivaria]
MLFTWGNDLAIKEQINATIGNQVVKKGLAKRALFTMAVLGGAFAPLFAQAELTFGIVAPSSGGAAPLGLGMQKVSKPTLLRSMRRAGLMAKICR